MSNLTIAVLAPDGYADNPGKKGTTSDITFYSLKKGEATVTLIKPTRDPEKLSSLPTVSGRLRGSIYFKLWHTRSSP
jgi:hypothetical protein